MKRVLFTIFMIGWILFLIGVFALYFAEKYSVDGSDLGSIVAIFSVIAGLDGLIGLFLIFILSDPSSFSLRQ